MFKTPIHAQPPFIQLIVFTGIVFVSLTIFYILSIILNILLFDVNFLATYNILGQLENPTMVRALKLMQLLNHLSVFLVPSLIFGFIVTRKRNISNEQENENSIMKYFSLASIPSFFSLLLVGIIMIAALPLINWMIAINEHLSLPDFMSSIEQWMKESEGAATDIIEAFLKTEGVTAFLYNFFIIAIIPAIGEELLFRGILQPLLIKWTKNVHKGIWITGILFSAFHLQFFGFVPRMLLGVLFGYLLLWSRSLWLPVFAHFINNGMAVIVSYLIQRNAVSKDIETIGSGESETMLIFCSAFLVIAFLFMIYRNKLRKYLITQ